MFINNLIEKPTYFFSFVLVALFSIIIHELAHGFAAISQGDKTPQETGHLTLNPIKHMGWLGIIFLCMFGISWGAMPVNPANFKHKNFSQTVVSLAGPVSNLMLGFGFIYVYSLGLFVLNNNEFFATFCLSGALINFVLFLFNLFPLPPLDGFSVAKSLIPPLAALDNKPQISFVLLIIMLNVPALWKGLYNVAQQMTIFAMKTFI